MSTSRAGWCHGVNEDLNKAVAPDDNTEASPQPAAAPTTDTGLAARLCEAERRCAALSEQLAAANDYIETLEYELLQARARQRGDDGDDGDDSPDAPEQRLRRALDAGRRERELEQRLERTQQELETARRTAASEGQRLMKDREALLDARKRWEGVFECQHNLMYNMQAALDQAKMAHACAAHDAAREWLREEREQAIWEADGAMQARMQQAFGEVVARRDEIVAALQALVAGGGCGAAAAAGGLEARVLHVRTAESGDADG